MTPKRSAHARRYAQISGCGENERLQDGLSANENEYSCDGTSQTQPGEVLSRQVPPTSPARSKTRRSWTPCCLSRIAAPRPPKPPPTTATCTCGGAPRMTPPHARGGEGV